MTNVPVAIQFLDVSYTLEPQKAAAGLDDDEVETEEADEEFATDRLPVLRDVTLDLPAGRCYALLDSGRAGGGLVFDLINGTRQPNAGTITGEGRVIALHRVRAVTGGSISCRLSIETLFGLAGYSRAEIRRAQSLAAASLGIGVDRLRRSYSEIGKRGYVRLCFHTALALKPDILLLEDDMLATIAAEDGDGALGVLNDPAMTVLIGCRSMRWAELVADEELVMEDGWLGPRELAPRPHIPENPLIWLASAQARRKAGAVRVDVTYQAREALDLVAMTIELGSGRVLLSRETVSAGLSLRPEDRLAITIDVPRDHLVQRAYGLQIRLAFEALGAPQEIGLHFPLPPDLAEAPVELPPDRPLPPGQLPLLALPLRCTARRIER